MRGIVTLTLFLLAGLACQEVSGGRWWNWFRPRPRPRPFVTFTIRNDLREPTFEESMEVRLFRGEPFIRVMERAANKNSTFRFSADYFNFKLGYFITTINKVQADYSLDNSFWAFLSAPDTLLNKGVSNYYPRFGEHLIFNLTNGTH